MNLLEFANSQIKAVELVIESLTGNPVVCERLHEMGLHRGQKIRYLGRAPLRGPLLIQFGTSVLALRGEEAQCTQIQAI